MASAGLTLVSATAATRIVYSIQNRIDQILFCHCHCHRHNEIKSVSWSVQHSNVTHGTKKVQLKIINNGKKVFIMVLVDLISGLPQTDRSINSLIYRTIKQ